RSLCGKWNSVFGGEALGVLDIPAEAHRIAGRHARIDGGIRRADHNALVERGHDEAHLAAEEGGVDHPAVDAAVSGFTRSEETDAFRTHGHSFIAARDQVGLAE